TLERIGDKSGERIFFQLACHSDRSEARSSSRAKVEASRQRYLKDSASGSLDFARDDRLSIPRSPVAPRRRCKTRFVVRRAGRQRTSRYPGQTLQAHRATSISKPRAPSDE